MMKSAVDSFTSRGVDGWAIADSGRAVAIEARLDGRVIGRTTTKAFRPDVAVAYPGVPGADRAGFSVQFDAGAPLPDRPVTVEIFARDDTAERHIGSGTVVSASGIQRVQNMGQRDSLSAYPCGLEATARELFPNSDAPIAAMAAQRDLLTMPLLSDYLRYLNACQSHFAFVERGFPSRNSNVQTDDKDFFCRQNSAFEMMGIAHHLYVLRSFGVTGAFAEFGCFKGFSSCMLSYACDLLGIDMHIYDSFEGLPPSDSTYYAAGDYAGSLDEVRANLVQFGCIDAVTFHKGFFSDSLAREEVPALMSLWMDVDLESSARDLGPAFDRVDPKGAIFSHECDIRDFVDGVPVARLSGPDQVVPVIMDLLGSVRASLAGRHIGGNTGAFWSTGTSLPVADVDSVLAILAAGRG
jgi:O-methyltransferase